MKETLEVTIELIELDDPPKQISVVTEVPLKDIDGVKYVPWSRAAHALLISDTTLTRWHNRGYYETPNGIKYQ